MSNAPDQKAIEGASVEAAAIVPQIRSPRERRLLLAVLEAPQSREYLDRSIGASNTPDVVFRLRKKSFALPCRFVPALDRDGKPCHYSEYSATDDDRLLAMAALSNSISAGPERRAHE